MTRIADRTVLFADLRGSTALYERLGNAQASALVTRMITNVAARVPDHGGVVIKTLGDGLMAVFDSARLAMQCAVRMQDGLDPTAKPSASARTPAGVRGQTLPAPLAATARTLRLQVALASGEVVEINGDCFGDAVNVAARLLDHASDGEVLVTQRVYATLPPSMQAALRHIDNMALRGRVEPVSVYVLGGRRAQDTDATAFADMPEAEDPDGIRLVWMHQDRVFDSSTMPIELGRSTQASFSVRDNRVSRVHARIDWHSGGFQLSDLSSNGTSVRFADGEMVSLRRGSCTLHGHGRIGLGGAPHEEGSATVNFEVIRVGDTQT
jgi:class 3 adenylate cyclase